ncbi:hypothetical protein [Pseudarthrobacter quantipunctorum]|jgi:hypothetical protein|uniref:UsfY protein n=1 Tax=Pseudarthrobacter quantipunctorum TaxID=3128980 RepID=A0ABZ2R8L5_9MICC
MFPSDPGSASTSESAEKDGRRILHPTVAGELHRYSRDELGAVTASSHPQVRSAGGFLVMAVVFAAVAVFSIMLVAGPTSRGQDPLWGALVLTVAGIGGVLYAARMARVASRARRLRAERGLPEPSARQFDR